MKRNLIRLLATGLSTSMLVGCGVSTTERENLPPLQTVAKVDIELYMGGWYEIANYPQSFQKGCTGTTANYSLRDDGEVDVVNRCFLQSLQGEEKVARGRARVVNEATNAELEVSFFRPFWGDYWVVELDEKYRYAVVGHPGRDYLWILSRTPQMDPSTYDGIIARLKENHRYDPSRLVKTLQPAN
jgi:apolipoprotein D and lipocalin family protein